MRAVGRKHSEMHFFYEKFRLNRPRVCIVFVRIVMKSFFCVVFVSLFAGRDTICRDNAFY